MAPHAPAPEEVKPSRGYLLPLGIVAGLAGGFVAGVPAGYVYHTPPEAKVYFSPNGGCTSAITSEIAGAQEEVLVQAYVFDSEEIANALVTASQKNSKLQVRVLMDKDCETNQTSQAGPLSERGINVRVDHHHQTAHNKVIIIDKKKVITGSFNFTNAAESRNAENLLILTDPELCAKYVSNFSHHWEHSGQFQYPASPVNLSPISPEEASKKVGQDCLVALKVQSTGTNGTYVFLNSHWDFKSPTNFAIVVSSQGKPRTYSSFEEFTNKRAALVGKTIQVSGKVSLFDGRPQIMVKNPSQFQALQP